MSSRKWSYVLDGVLDGVRFTGFLALVLFAICIVLALLDRGERHVIDRAVAEAVEACRADALAQRSK